MVEKMNNNFNNLMSIYINNKEKDAIDKNDELNEEHTALFEEKCNCPVTPTRSALQLAFSGLRPSYAVDFFRSRKV